MASSPYVRLGPGGHDRSIDIPFPWPARTIVVAHVLIDSQVPAGGPVGLRVGDYVIGLDDGGSVVVPIRELFEIGRCSGPMATGRALWPGGSRARRFSPRRMSRTGCTIVPPGRGAGRPADDGVRAGLPGRLPPLDVAGAGQPSGDQPSDRCGRRAVRRCGRDGRRPRRGPARADGPRADPDRPVRDRGGRRRRRARDRRGSWRRDLHLAGPARDAGRVPRRARPGVGPAARSVRRGLRRGRRHAVRHGRDPPRRRDTRLGPLGRRHRRPRRRPTRVGLASNGWTGPGNGSARRSSTRRPAGRSRAASTSVRRPGSRGSRTATTTTSTRHAGRGTRTSAATSASAQSPTPYIDGTCQGWLPRGEVIVEVARGFETEPLRQRVTIEPASRSSSSGSGAGPTQRRGLV